MTGTWSHAGQGLFDWRCGELAVCGLQARLTGRDAVWSSKDAVLVSEENSAFQDEDGQGTRHSYTFEWDNKLRLVLRAYRYSDRPMAVVRSAIRNIGAEAVALDQYELRVEGAGGIELGEGLRDWVMYRNGMEKNDPVSTYQFANPAFELQDMIARGTEHAGLIETKLTGDSIRISSYGMAALHSSVRQTALTAGFLTLRNQFAFISLVCGKDEQELEAFMASCSFDGYVLNPGEEREAERVLLYAGPAFEGIDAYADLSGRLGGARLSDQAASPSGWCSWYFFYESVTEQDVLGNAEALKERGARVDYIQIDDGWQQRHGDWHGNYKFPSGMKAVADKLHALGFKAGLWLAPFWVEPRSWVHRERPEWLLRDESGQLVVFHCHIDGYVVDPTIPEARAWIRETFRRVIHEWGYDYVKIDFLRAVSMFPGVKYAVPATRAEALRLGLEAVREGTGDDAFILACGGQYGPTLGMADGNRTSNDINGNWDSVRHTFKKNLLRYWMNNRWWVNDPDCLILRGEGDGTPGSISGYKRVEKGSLTEVEVQTVLALLRATGGLAFIGDDLNTLDSGKIDLIVSSIPYQSKAAVPRDMFTERFPHVLHKQLEDGLHELTIVNWTDEPMDKSLKLGDAVGSPGDRARYRIREYWSREEPVELGAQEELRVIGLEAHGCRLYQIERIG